MHRCFVAMDPTPETRSVLIDTVQPLGAMRQPGARLRLLGPEQLHITLAFLGATAENQLPDVRAALADVAATQAAVRADLDGLSAFPRPERPHSIHACIGRGQEQVVALMAAIEEACAPLGFQREERSRVPHLTLVRVHDAKPHSALSQWLQNVPRRVYGPVDGTSFTLFASIRRPEGSSLYQPLARFSLG